MHEESIAKAAEYIASTRDCILALIDDDGYPTAATITPTKNDGIRRIFIGNSTGSNWAKRIEKCSRASICYSSSNPECNITLVGDMEIMTDDIALKKEMWSDWMQQYYSGPDDPGYCVLRFTTRRYSMFVNGEQVRGTV